MAAFTAFTAPYSRAEFPQESQVICVGPIAASALDNTTIGIAVFDREVDIESITIRAATAGSAHALTFRVAASGTALASGTAINAGDSAAGLTGAVTWLVPMAQAGNPHLNVAAGSVLALGAASGLTTLAGLMIAIRTRTRKVTTNTAGTKEFNKATP